MGRLGAAWISAFSTRHVLNMDLLIDSAARNAMFSFMDGFSGYNQIWMSPKDAKKNVFHTPIGNFYYTIMPFGLKNAGATYQSTMTAMFHDMIHQEIETMLMTLW